MDVAMWGKALRVIPRISKDDWNALDVISRWLIAARSAVLVITFIPACMAGILAFRDGKFDGPLFLWTTFGLLMAHATNNLVNDLTDHLKGVDTNNYFRAQYGPQALEHGLLTMNHFLIYTAVTGLLALVAGAYLVSVRGTPALLLLAAGAFFVLCYTFPLKYIGLGEIAVLVVWGPLMVGGAYYIITGEWRWDVAVASLPYALGATSVIFGKHIDKYAEDKAKHIRTLPVLIGDRAARAIVSAMFVLQYVLTFALILISFFSLTMLAVLLVGNLFLRVMAVYRHPKPTEPPKWYPAGAWPLWFVAFAFQHNRRFGTLFLVGMIADVAVRMLLLR
jgi:1,4-dihydroxy-2-naphthoate polyprenyltransferase